MDKQIRGEWLKLDIDASENNPQVSSGCYECGRTINMEGVADWWLERREKELLLIISEIKKLKAGEAGSETPEEAGGVLSKGVEDLMVMVKNLL